MAKLTSKQHTVQAIIGIGIAFLSSVTLGLGAFFDTERQLALLWLLLLLLIVPAVGWGSIHLARARGYSGGGGCGLCIVGYIVSGFLGTTSSHPLALGLGSVFMVLLPTVVLLAMPNKAALSRRRRQ